MDGLPKTSQKNSQSKEFDTRTESRHRNARIWLLIFMAATMVGIVALTALLYNVINGVAGYTVIEYRVEPSSLAFNGVPLEDLEKDQLIQVLEENVSSNVFRTLNQEKPMEQRSESEIYSLILERVLRPKVLATYPLFESLLNRNEVFADAQARFPDATIEFKNWLTIDFVVRPQASEPIRAGARTAILGSLFIILITILFSFPVGTGAAIYLQEYADPEKRINRFLQTNINNLAGVPSIIYGMLGLTIFVRALEPLTSGSVFTQLDPGTTANGRTIISAGLTLGLLILPVIIINAQEAIKAVPGSLRQASYGIGATKWQTVWSHVLPNSLPGILTGTILAVSRAIGETAPLVIVGASTFITFDPEGVFSKFTALPIQIYQWTARPQPDYRSIAAAAIIILLVMLLTLNATAILLRNRYSTRY
jgi:phosphate transport system permease protein